MDIHNSYAGLIDGTAEDETIGLLEESMFYKVPDLMIIGSTHYVYN